VHLALLRLILALRNRDAKASTGPAVRRGRRVEFKEIGDSTDQVDLCAAAPVVGTADRWLIRLDVSAF
jgi:hypothetical protein